MVADVEVGLLEISVVHAQNLECRAASTSPTLCCYFISALQSSLKNVLCREARKQETTKKLLFERNRGPSCQLLISFICVKDIVFDKYVTHQDQRKVSLSTMYFSPSRELPTQSSSISVRLNTRHTFCQSVIRLIYKSKQQFAGKHYIS